ncbi:MAG: hypothetical protein ACUVX1_15285 [Chloroflexota bacterium]
MSFQIKSGMTRKKLCMSFQRKLALDVIGGWNPGGYVHCGFETEPGSIAFGPEAHPFDGRRLIADGRDAYSYLENVARSTYTNRYY